MIKTVPTSFQDCANRGHHDVGFESAHPRNIGLLCRASDMPAKTAKKIAIAGCIKTRKLIGPLKRPTRFSQPRAKASSSMNHLPPAKEWWRVGPVRAATK